MAVTPTSRADHGCSFSQCWDTGLGTGISGTLISANRGLLIFTPWIALALLTLPMVFRAHPSLLAGLLAALGAGALPGAAGEVPLVDGRLVVRAAVLDRRTASVRHHVGVRARLGADASAGRPSWSIRGAAALAVAIQLIGVFYYPSSWNAWPENSDRHRERLWSWTDSELGRCLSEGVHPATYRPWSRWAYPSAIGSPALRTTNRGPWG